MVFQQLALFPHMTVAENIAYGLVERKESKRIIAQRVIEMLDLVNLAGMGERYPAQLSGGQQQRVALARSLCLSPSVLLLDEPLAALDRKLRKEMQIELKRIQREVGTTFLNVTHDQKEALSLSDRIAVIRKGQIEQMGSPKQIYESPRTHFVASFMGATNIFSGSVDHCEADQIVLQTEEGYRLLAPGCNNEVDTVSGISIHPEMISIHSGDNQKQCDSDPNLNVICGTIQEIFYQGDFSEVTIRVSNTHKHITVYLHREKAQEDLFTNGQDIVLSWDWRSTNPLTG
jgi:ABC-type Fe3+/spermidine/putrescine transport system ATPase subunit